MQNNEKIEKKLISLILESSKQSINLSEKYLTNTKKLFESVYFKEEISSPINFNDCRNNKFYFFKKVKEEILELQKNVNSESLKIINESLATEKFKNSVVSFISDLNNEINFYQKQNDFDKIDLLNNIVKKTLLFSHKPIFINGFNIQQFLDSNNIIYKEILEKFGANIKTDLKLLILNKSDKELYFIFERKLTNEKTIIFYDILENKLDYLINNNFDKYGSDKDLFFNEIWKNEKNYNKIIGKYINNNLIEIYKNNDLYKTIKFEDNLYGDYSYQKRMEMMKNQKLFK